VTPADAGMTPEEAAAALHSLIDIRREISEWRREMYENAVKAEPDNDE
jgi:hypothetical protein